MNGTVGIGYGAEFIAWGSTHVPNWQKDSDKTTRLYVVVYPSDKQSRTFGPETFAYTGKPTATGSIARAITSDEIEGLGYGLYIEPAKESGTKKLFRSGPKVDARLFTFEEVDGGRMEVKLRSGTGSGVHGMLVRFLVGQYQGGEKVSDMMQKIHTIMDDTVFHQKDAGVSGIQMVLKQLQRTHVIGKWSVNEFIQTMDMVVEDARKEGTKLASVTTVNYLAHVNDLR